MKVRYDAKADAVYLRLDDSTIVDSEEVQPGVTLDFNADRHVVGVEILDVRRRLPVADVSHIDFDMA